MEKIKKILKQEYDADYSIKDIYLFKAGCVLLQMEELDDNNNYPVTAKEEIISKYKEDFDISINLKELFNKIKEHRNIFNPEEYDSEYPVTHSEPSPGTAIIVDGPKLFMEVKLPKSKQYLTDDFINTNPIEEFNAIFNGSLFITYAKINEFPSYTTFGYEYRNLLRNIINEDTKLHCPHFGPSPIHPDFYVIILEKDIKDLKNRIIKYGNDLIMVLEEIEMRDFADYFLEKISFELERYYKIEYYNTNLIDYNIEIHNILEELSKKINSFYILKWYSIFETNKIINESKLLLSRVYKRYFEYESQKSYFNKNRLKYIDEIKQHKLFSLISKYFNEQLDELDEIPTSILDTLSHYGNIINSFGDKRTAVWASIIGALIGAFITYLVS